MNPSLTVDYNIHGLVVRSAIPFLNDALVHPESTRYSNPHSTADVLIEPIRQLSEAEVSDQGQVIFEDYACEIHQVSASKYFVTYPVHDLVCLIDLRADENGMVRVSPRSKSPDVSFFFPVLLWGSLLAVVVRLHRVGVLHANTVNYLGQTIAFAGPSGAGKTFTSALTLTDGADLVSDDVTVVRRDGFVHPGLVELRLRVEGSETGQIIADLLSHVESMTNRATPDGRQAFRKGNGDGKPLKLTRIVLPNVDRDATKMQLERLDVRDGLRGLLTSQRLTGWKDKVKQQEDFLFAAFLCETVSIERLTIPSIQPTKPSISQATIELRNLFV
jgi:hypothetical protein